MIDHACCCDLRRDSNILLPKTPSMKRKRQESDEERSSDDSVFLTVRETKTRKTQGYASPLTVINENELLDCSVANEEGKKNDVKRTTRATRANSRPTRQQPKRGSRKQNLPDVGSSAEEETSGSSSMDEKPRRNTRNSRKKNLELQRLTEEKAVHSSSGTDDKDFPKRATRNSRRKHMEENADFSSIEEQPMTKKRSTCKSSADLKSKDSGEIPLSVIVKQERLSPPNEIQTRQSTRNSGKKELLAEELADSRETETENRVHVPETPQPVSVEAITPPASTKTCKATINVVLQISSTVDIPNATGATPILTSSPCIEQTPSSCTSKDLGSQGVTVEENKAHLDEETILNNDTAHVCLPTPNHISSQNFVLTCTATSENKEELESGEENVPSDEKNFDVDNVNVDLSKEDVSKETTVEANPGEKSRRSSRGRSSGWRRKSKRLSNCLSYSSRRLSTNQKVTRSKCPGKKSLVKSSVKLKLTQSKLMPELKIHSADKYSNDENPASNLEDVRVRLFDNLTSESSSQSATSATNSSCSSAEDKTEAPVERITEEPAEDDNEEVFHDCRGSENEDDGETEDGKCTNTKRFAPQLMFAMLCTGKMVK